MKEPGTVVILAPMNVEYKAVRRQISQLRPVRHPEGTAFEVGRLPGVPWDIALGLTGEGNPDMAALAERAVATFRPLALFVVGVAGGLHHDVELGDVVVATWVYGYHGGKEEGGGFRARPRAWRAGHKLEQAARMVEVKGTWGAYLPGRAAVHFKPVAAGEVVLNSRDAPLAHQLSQHYGDAAAIEMESAGAASAAHLNGSVPMLTIRGISDKADGGKHASDAAGWQPVAASHAAAFTAAVLKELAAAQEPLAGGPRPEPAGTGSAPDVPGLAGAWRPLTGPLPVLWVPDLVRSRRMTSAVLELHLVPTRPGQSPEARRLAALTDELMTLGRAVNMFTPADHLEAAAPAVVCSEAGAGLAVARSGQRSGWTPLPKDALGAVLDPADITARLTDLLTVLLRIGAPDPGEAGLAVGVTPFVMIAEGHLRDMPRTGRRGRTSLSPVRVAPAEVLPVAGLSAAPGGIAEELSARLLLAFRAPRD